MRTRRTTPDDLARLEREALRRASGVKLPGPEARANSCESCGAGTVRWGGLCNTCRARLLAARAPEDE
ncbi:MAG TPA: hypothetical protein PKE32_06250 [Miltoncostaeaceae bacterium]|nr:hypothetical protein [Miltoncostaeaceae bacterium]